MKNLDNTIGNDECIKILNFIYNEIPDAFKNLDVNGNDALKEICTKLKIEIKDSKINIANYSDIIKTIKFNIFDLLKTNNNDSYAFRVIFKLKLEDINEKIINDAINFDIKLNKLVKAEERIKQFLSQNSIDNIDDLSQIKIFMNIEESANDIYVMENKSNNKKYYVKTFCKDSYLLGSKTYGRIHPNELFVYKILEYTGFGPKTWFLIKSGSSSDNYSSVYSKNYIMTEDVAGQDCVFLRDLKTEINDELFNSINKDNNYATLISLAASIDQILSLADTFGRNANNYGIVMSKTDKQNYTIKLIDHIPNANNGILSIIKNDPNEIKQYSPRDALLEETPKMTPIIELTAGSYKHCQKNSIFEGVYKKLFNKINLEKAIEISKDEIISLIDKHGFNFIDDAKSILNAYYEKICKNIETYKQAVKLNTGIGKRNLTQEEEEKQQMPLNQYEKFVQQQQLSEDFNMQKSKLKAKSLSLKNKFQK